MKSRITIALAAGLIATAGTALAAFSDIDTDGDGALSGEEFVAAFPDLTGEHFVTIDLNADGAITEDEHIAAVEAGLLPAE